MDAVKALYEWGNKEKQTLFFLHGLGSTGLSFGELAQYLLDDYHIVSFDLAGHGSEKQLLNEDDYRPSRMAMNIKKNIETIGKSEIFLIGHSWGAHLALYYAQAYPEQIKGLILLDGGYFQDTDLGSLEEELINIEGFFFSVRFPTWDEFIKSEKVEINRWSEELEKASRAQVTERDGEIRMVTSVFTAQAAVKGMYAEPTREVFSQISIPVLLLRSTLPKEIESIRKKATKLMEEKMSNIEVRDIQDSTHDIYRDAPNDVANSITSWIEKINV